MDKDSRKVTEEAWLICPNWTEVRRFTKNKNNKDKFFEYMFVFLQNLQSVNFRQKSQTKQGQINKGLTD